MNLCAHTQTLIHVYTHARTHSGYVVSAGPAQQLLLLATAHKMVFHIFDRKTKHERDCCEPTTQHQQHNKMQNNTTHDRSASCECAVRLYRHSPIYYIPFGARYTASRRYMLSVLGRSSGRSIWLNGMHSRIGCFVCV